MTHLRKNILNWYDFNKESDALEIGCGLGAVTSVLCGKCKTVTAVELSKRRATAAWLRCREKENLEIIVGNLNDIQFEKKFDYITLIGVLEYQGSYTNSENPYKDLYYAERKAISKYRAEALRYVIAHYKEKKQEIPTSYIKYTERSYLLQKGSALELLQKEINALESVQRELVQNITRARYGLGKTEDK